MQYLATEGPGVGHYNLNSYQNNQHVTGFRYKTDTVKDAPKKKKRGKLNKENLSKTLIPGTFDWIAAEARPFSSNRFGLSKRFKAIPRSEKQPAPNAYKLNTTWGDEANVLNKSASCKMFRSVYHH